LKRTDSDSLWSISVDDDVISVYWRPRRDWIDERIEVGVKDCLLASGVFDTIVKNDSVMEKNEI
jgi:hypothetical protein